MPTALKALHGNPGQRRMPDAEPLPPGALDAPPHWMTAEQRAAWTYALEHAPPGLLRRLDRGLLAVWVVAEDTHRKAAILLQANETLMMRIGDPDKGEPTQVFPSLYLGIMNKQALIMIKAASELGFSPAARARTYARSGPDDPLPPARVIDGKVHRTPLATYLAQAPTRPRMN